ncbi:MAG: hypothetical protein NT088_00695 [Candidatus Omnitrophica bacterium]|nr:hypothetical protein [Candidatus Omnitrophota bacterium]
MRNRTAGFTIIEVLFVALALGAVTAAFFYAMSAGQISFNLSSSKIKLQAQVRNLTAWITKDAHQAVSWDIANNNPGPGYIKLRQVTGWDSQNNSFLWSDYYIEYTYDADLSTITRRTSDLSNNTLMTWTFDNITAAPFFTVNSSGSPVALNANDLLTSKKLIITITGQNQVIGFQPVVYSLTEEVQIRNG